VKARAAILAPTIGLPVLMAVAFCLVFALQLGALQPEFYFQKSPMPLYGASGSQSAYASGNSLLFKLMHAKNQSSRAAFEGHGEASSLSYLVDGAGMNITKIEVNGKIACSPCLPNKKYRISANGSLEVEIFSNDAPIKIPADDTGLMRRVYFERNLKTWVETPVFVSIDGGWASTPNSAIPSSFYGVDAPFHLHRVPIGAGHLLRGEIPWAEYTFISVLPASALYALLGVSHQYAYKLWEIALLFAPVAAFYLFSRKLTQGRDAIFLFASLLYLFIPSQGMLVGGGADLFLYGMTAHTLATTLSLVCLFFSYEFVFERKNSSFWPYCLFFALAVASNQRIALPLFIGLGALAAFSLVLTGVRRTALLLAAGIAIAAVFLAPLLAQADQIGAYSLLGGASVETLGWSIVGFFQLGYYALPLLFILGVGSALAKHEMLPIFLFATCVLVFAFATSPEMNRMIPFLDGLRFMPSFFLPVFFLSGIGALAAFEKMVALAKKIGKRLALDELDTAVSFALAVLLPLSALFISLALSSSEQYAHEANSLEAASEYTDLKAAYGIIGDECVLIEGKGGISSYPIFEEGLERTIISGGNPDDMAQQMEKTRCRYLLFGNLKQINGEAEAPRWQEYAAFEEDDRFEEIEYGDSPKLFMLKNVTPAAKVEAPGARIDGYSFDFDRGTVAGECLENTCSLRIRKDALPPSLACGKVESCKMRLAPQAYAFYIEDIPRGKFYLAFEPKNADWIAPLALASIAIVGACGYAAGRMKETAKSKPGGKRK
jgi:hypothetical protein